MARQILSDLLNDKIKINTFDEWISGKETKDINSSASRTEFVLYILNYIQESTNKCITAVSQSGTQQKLKGRGETQVKNLKKTPEQESKELKKGSLQTNSTADSSIVHERDCDKKTPDNETPQRSPFKHINRVTPTRTANQSFPRYLSFGTESRDVLQQSTGRSESTSTPTHRRRNNSGHDYSPISPPQSSHSFLSDQSSTSHTPRSSRGSGTKFNSSSGSHRSNTSTFSPTSPQYSDNFPGLGGRGRGRTPPSPCLSDFIASKPNSRKNRKRIKPTQITTVSDKDVTEDSKKGNKGFGTVSRPFTNITSPLAPQSELKEKSNFEEERSLLKQKRMECSSVLSGSPVTILSCKPSTVDKSKCEEELNKGKPDKTQCLDISVQSQAKSMPPSQLESIEPNPNLITSSDKVVRLAAVYSACLDANLVPNIISELYLIFTLLTTTYSVNVNSTKDNKPENQSQSTLSNDQCIVSLLDLSLEEKNTAAVSYGDELVSKKEKSGSVLSSVHNCVMFAAVVIEKQIHLVRLLDRAIVRLLLENSRLSLFVPHFIPQLVQVGEEAKDVSSSPARKPVVLSNQTVLFHTETDNKDNFSSEVNFSVFKKQRDGFYEILHEWRSKNSDSQWNSKRFPSKVHHLMSLSNDPVNMMHLARLFCAQLTNSKCAEESVGGVDLPGVPQDKLSLLKARFSKPADPSGSPRPSSQFPGEQLFYQQFIQLVIDSRFLSHVVDCLTFRIHQLNDTTFFADGLGIGESKGQVFACVTDCCLLSKFLGYIVYLPYRTSTPLSPDTLPAQMLVRQQVTPPVNLLTYVQRALQSNRLVVTVPWVVAFLGMMDRVSLHMPFYQPILQLLVSLYCSLPLPHLSTQSCLLLRCSLGWLFDVSFFPEEVFFSLVENKVTLEGNKVDPDDVDVKDIVDQGLVSELCPFLVHLRILLSSSSSYKQRTARHITPVPAQLVPPTKVSIAQTIELQLEESFLSGQATSFRATMDFVVDRVSSSCIKHICSNVIASCKEEASTNINQRKEELSKMDKKEVFLSKLINDTEAKVEAALSEHCGPKIQAALVALLGPDSSDSLVLQTTLQICGRRSRERVISWLNSHMNLSEMYSKLMSQSSEAKAVGDESLNPLQGRIKAKHRDEVMSPSELIIKLQNTLCRCIENRVFNPHQAELMLLVTSAIKTLRDRSDLLPAAKQTIYATSIDLCIAMLTYQPDKVTRLLLSALCGLWSTCQSADQLERLLSARNVLMLCQAGAHKAPASWRQMSTLLVELLKEKLLTPQQLEAQCIALFRLDWPPMVLTLMGECLSLTLEKIKQDPICKENPKFVLMLEWVHEMTEDLASENMSV